VPHVATSPTDLLDALKAVAHLDGDRLVIDDEAGFRGAGIRDLAWTAAFTTDEATTAAAQWLVWEAGQELGARSASIQDLYAARGRGEVHGFTVPATHERPPSLPSGWQKRGPASRLRVRPPRGQWTRPLWLNW
jgi:hypothetical protein